MKRLIIAFLLTAGMISVQAQDLASPTLNYSALERKLEKSNEEIQDEKDKKKAKTWLNRGELFLDIHQVNIEFIRLGMSASEARLYLKEPNEIKTVEKGGVTYEHHIYDRITLIYQNEVLQDFVETEVLHPDPLTEALHAFKEALRLDDRGRRDDKVLENLEKLKRLAEGDAIRAFTKGNYDDALAKFELIMEASETEVYDNYIDSVIIYNAALAAKNAGKHELSAKYFEKSTEIGYGGSDAYYLLKNEYIALEDSAKALDALQRGYRNYPDTTLILFELVNYYLSIGNAEEGMKFLELAQEQESGNPSIYFAKGTLYERMGEKEKAMEEYKKSLEVDPEFYNSWFNIGALHFNNAVELYDTANTKEDLEEYNAAKKLADDELKRAIEPMLKAHELNPDEKSTLETLRTIYYRLQMEEKYEEVNEKLENME